MVENRPFVTFLSHLVLILGVIIVAFPVWMTFVASTHDQMTMLQSPVPMWPGTHLIDNYLPEGMLGLAVTGMLAAFMAGVAANVTAFNTVVTYDLIQAYFAKDRDSAFYPRAGRR